MEEARQGNAVRITSVAVFKARRAFERWMEAKADLHINRDEIDELTELIRDCLWATEECDDRLAAANNIMRNTRDMRNTQEHLSRIGIDTISIDPRTGKTYVARSNRQVQVNPIGAA